MAVSGSIGDVFVRLGIDPSGLSSGFAQAESTMERLGNRLFYMGGRLTAGVTLPIVAGTTAIAKWGMAFDKAMTESLAIMSDVTPQIRKQMEDTAMAVSDVTKFSSEEAAAAYYDLASAGLTAVEAMGSIETVAKFAQAGVMDLKKAGEFLAGSVSAVGDASLGTTGKIEGMAKMSDLLTQANNYALGTVEDFANAITNRAGQALRMYNVEVEEGIAVLMAYAEQNIRGKVAGQQLYIALRDLQRYSQQAPAEWKRLGIEVFDATGNMNSMSTIIGQMERAFAGMSEQQKVAAFRTLELSDRSRAAITSLIGMSSEIRRYEVALANAGGTTERVAERQMQAMHNQLLQLWHQFQNVGIEIYQKFVPVIETYLIPAFKRMIAELRQFTEWLDTLSTAQKSMVLGSLAFAAALGPLIGFIGSFTILLRAATSGLGALLIPLVHVAQKGLGALIPGLTTATSKMGLFQRALVLLRNPWTWWIAAIGQVVMGARDMMGSWDRVYDLFSGATLGILPLLVQGFAGLGKTIADIVAITFNFTRGITNMAKILGNFVKDIVQDALNKLADLGGVIRKVIEAMAQPGPRGREEGGPPTTMLGRVREYSDFWDRFWEYQAEGGNAALSAAGRAALQQAMDAEAERRAKMWEASMAAVRRQDDPAAFAASITDPVTGLLIPPPRIGMEGLEEGTDKVLELTKSWTEASEAVGVFHRAFAGLSKAQKDNVTIQEMLVGQIEQYITAGVKITDAERDYYRQVVESNIALIDKDVALLESRDVTLELINAMKEQGYTEEQIANLWGVKADALTKLIAKEEQYRVLVNEVAQAEMARLEETFRASQEVFEQRSAQEREMVEIWHRSFQDLEAMTKYGVEAQIHQINRRYDAEIQRIEGMTKIDSDYKKQTIANLNEMRDHEIMVAGDTVRASREAYEAMVKDARNGIAAIDAAWDKWFTDWFADTHRWVLEWGKIVDQLASAFQQLAQVAGGTIGNLIQQIGTLFASMSVVFKGIEAFERGKQKRKEAGKELEGLMEMMGGMVAMAAGFWQATGAENPFLAAAGGALTGAQIGMELAGPMGAMVGAVAGGITGLVRSLVGGPSEQELEGRKVAENFRKGLQEGLSSKQLREAMSTGNVRWASEVIAIRDTYLALGKTEAEALDVSRRLWAAEKEGGEAVQKVIDEITVAFDRLKKRQENAKLFMDKLAQAMSYVKDSGRLASKELLDLIKTTEGFGKMKTEINDFVISGLQKGVAGIATALENGTTKTAGNIAAMASTLVLSFNEMVRRGMSAAQAMETVGPVVNTLKRLMRDTGLEGTKAFETIDRMAQYMADETVVKAIKTVSGLEDALVGLHNAGILDQETFAGLSNQITETYQGLIAKGYHSNEVIRLMGPELQTIWELMEDFGFEVSDATREIVNQGVQAGVVGEHMRDDNERLISLMEELVQLMRDFIDEMRHALGLTNDIVDAANKIPDNPFENWVPPDSVPSDAQGGADGPYWGPDGSWNPPFIPEAGMNFPTVPTPPLPPVMPTGPGPLPPLAQPLPTSPLPPTEPLPDIPSGFEWTPPPDWRPDDYIPDNQYAYEMPQFAEGAYVTGPTPAIIGEGPYNEYVLPEPVLESALARARDSEGGGDTYVDVTIHTMSSAGFEQMVDNKLVPAVTTAIRRNRNGAKTKIRKAATPKAPTRR